MAQFQGMEFRNSEYAAHLEVLTPNTFVMMVLSDISIRMFISSKNDHVIESSGVLMNINSARKHFEQLEIDVK